MKMDREFKREVHRLMEEYAKSPSNRNRYYHQMLALSDREEGES